jgi:hypothetical protein
MLLHAPNGTMIQGIIMYSKEENGMMKSPSTSVYGLCKICTTTLSSCHFLYQIAFQSQKSKELTVKILSLCD